MTILEVHNRKFFWKNDQPKKSLEGEILYVQTENKGKRQ
jgi:hypothetical protein